MRNTFTLSFKNAFLPSLLSACLLLGGCTLAPHYIRPDTPIPSTYTPGVPGEISPENIGWKAFFTDPQMQRLIQIALENNRDLRIAMLNIEKTRHQYRIQRADILPTIAAAGAESMQHTPADLSPTQQATFSRNYSATLGFSGFELDLFGRIRSLTKQAVELHYSVEDEAKTAQLSLAAEVAAIYLQFVADKENYDFTKATMDNRYAQLKLIMKRAASGVASDLEVNQAKANYEEARGLEAQYKAQIKVDEHYLQLLIGKELPTDLADVRKLADVTPLQDLPEGLPSTLLERRPDIQAAEHRLMAANANIGAARANFFPQISLTGSYGTLSADYGNLFHSGQLGWSFAPQITLPIFDTGRNLAVLGVAETEKDIAIATYEKTIQSAFREVADAISQRDSMRTRIDAGKEQTLAANKSYVLADKRYKAGIDNYLTLLDTQRVYYLAEQNYISTRLLRETNALTLYKALGGGWQ